MEEILVSDANGNNKSVTESTALSTILTAPGTTSTGATLVVASAGSTTGADDIVTATTVSASSVDEQPARVMSMLYIQQGKLPAATSSSQSSDGGSGSPTTNAVASTSAASSSSSSSASAAAAVASTTTAAGGAVTSGNQQLVHVVNKSQIATFNQIVLQGLSQVTQKAIPQPITIRRQTNSVGPATSPTQKHILVRKSNASGAQIMPLSTAQDSQVHTQTGGKSGIAYLGTIIKPKPREPVVIPTGTLNTSQISKPKLVIAPVISHVAHTTSGTTNSIQNQPAKHMTNLLLPVSIPPQSASVSKQNLNFKQTINFKFSGGQINPDAKSTITVLRESKTSNSTTNPPPLHPIAKMSLLNVPKSNSTSTDSIKITENPDSAVITPIPKKDDSNLPEKRKKTISNILRGSGEKRIKKQSFSKSSSQEPSVVEVPSYTLNSPESEHEKDKKKDKESDDDITLIKVIPSEEKKIKRSLVADDIKIEVIKGNHKKDIKVIEKSEKMNGKTTVEDDIKDAITNIPKDVNAEATKSMEWKDGVGTLPGGEVQFSMNEFGIMSIVNKETNKERKDENIGDKENMCLTQNSSKSSTPTIVNEKKAEEKKTRTISAESFYSCEGCGCHGLGAEFDSINSCSPSCTEYIEVMKQQKLRKDKELNKEMRKKKRKKMLEEQQAKDKEKSRDSNVKSNEFDEKSKDSEDKIQDAKSETDEDTKDTNISIVDEESQEESESKYPWQTGKLGFSWSKYLEHTKTKAAPVKLFKDPFPYGKNNFKVGFKLEGIDPNNPSHYCVLTVAETVGYRIRLHFDGYAENFDFWVNADSMDIFPVGWAEKNGHKLQPPKGYVQNNFNWNAYLKICKAVAAPKTLFSNKNSMFPTGFRVGMKLEAVDRKHSSLVCVASVADVMDSRILVHFDSWDDVYDYWADVSSPYIHPIGWCHHNGRSLTPPNYYKDPKSFSWDTYLRATASTAAPARAFKQRPPCGFKRGMRIEAVDKRLPQLIRVATVEDVKDHMLKIRFDGWPENHAYWVDDDSPDIHPVGWCAKTGHPLEPPLIQDNLNDRPECGTFGCRGIGHVKGPKFATHNSASGCPYSPQNLNKIKTITDRLSVKHETNDYDEDFVLERSKSDKSEKTKERSEKRLSSFDDKSIKVENIKQEDDYASDNKNERVDTSERLTGNKWRNHNDIQADDDEIIRKRKKRKVGNDDSRILNILNSTHDSSASQMPYASNMPDKQLRTELYHSVYNPGYSPLPDAPHIWAKHSTALNRIVAKQNTNPRRWSNEEVIKFIHNVPNCKEIGSIFRKHNIDGEAFLMLTQEDLVTLLGLRLGPALKLYNSIVLLRRRVT